MMKTIMVEEDGKLVKKLIFTIGPVKYCSGCGRFMVVNEDGKFKPHGFLTKDEWCVPPSLRENQ